MCNCKRVIIIEFVIFIFPTLQQMADNALNTNQNPEAKESVNTAGNTTPAASSGDGLLDDLTTMMPQGGSTSALLAAADAAKAKADGKAAEAATAKSDLDLSGLAATVESYANTKEKEKKIDFAVQQEVSKKDIAMQEAIFERTFFNRMTRIVTLTLVFLVLATLGYVFQQYLRHVQGKSVSSMVDYYMPTIHKTFLQINKLIGQDPDMYGIDSLTTPTAQQTLTTIVSDKSMNYIVKKEALTKAADHLVRSTMTQYTKLDEIKQDIGSYGFFPKDVQIFAASTFIDNSLQKSLIAVEAIRFSTALTFFSNLDTFIQQFSSFVSLNATQV